MARSPILHERLPDEFDSVGHSQVFGLPLGITPEMGYDVMDERSLLSRSEDRMPVDDRMLQHLTDLASAASERAYCPHSGFRVGAAVLAQSGFIYQGCNVENASYGLTNCAERTAIFSMVAAGETRFEAIVIYTPTDRPTTPCGACRQVLFEFNREAEVICCCAGTEVYRTTVAGLLPGAFGPENLAR